MPYKDKNKLKEYDKQRRNNPVGRAINLLKNYVNIDRKYERIGDELPANYVTVSDIVRLITKKCTYFDECGTYGWRKIGLNRLDNSLPHTIDNVEPCCKSCNLKLAGEEKKKTFGMPIDQIDRITGEIIRTWKSAQEIERELGFAHFNIIRCCYGGYYDKSRDKWINITQAYGYVWRKQKKMD